MAAAGNNGDAKELTPEMVHKGITTNTASYPAALADVVGVGALDRDGKLAAFTPDPAPWIALLAPGVGLTGAYVCGEVTIERRNETGAVLEKRPVHFNGTATWEGCSFAARPVTGAIAAGTVPGRRSARQGRWRSCSDIRATASRRTIQAVNDACMACTSRRQRTSRA